MGELPDPFTREQLLTAFDSEWHALMNEIEGVSDVDLIEKTDASGWNTRDHLANLSAWLQSVIVMIRDGKPQWTGLDAPKELYGTDDYDPLNEAIRHRTIAWSPQEVIEELRSRHNEMIQIVSGMSDADLLKPANDFVENSGDFAICYKIDGNGPYHYREHRAWIAGILDCQTTQAG